MILIDTSAWIDFFRGAGASADSVAQSVREGVVATCGAVRMELLAGARDEAERTLIDGVIAAATKFATTERHYDSAAQIFRVCRRAGETPRALADCLIAAVAIDVGVPVLAADRDFQVIARHTSLVLA